MRRMRVAGLAAALLLLLPVTASAQTGPLEEQLDRSQDERARTQDELRDARSREGTAREQLAAIEAEVEQAQEGLARLEQELEDARAEVEAATDRARIARERLLEVEAAIGDLEDEFEEKRSRLDGRVRAVFKFGQVSFADTLTTANDMADFLNSNTYVSHVVAGDRELVVRVEQLIEEVQRQRGAAQELRVEAEHQTELAAAAQASVERALEEQQQLTELVEDRRVEHAEVLESLREDREALEGHLSGLEAESSRIQSQLAAIAAQQEAERQQREAERQQREAERQQREAEHQQREEERRAKEATDACADAREGGDEEAILDACGEPEPAPEPDHGPDPEPPVGGGSWTRPVGGVVTSPFGNRPSLGGYHWGVDLRGDVGTSIVASRGGTVVTAVGSCHPTNSWTCGGGFGNYVVIAHADGYATVYAHQSTISVGTGQQVSEGQVIGAVGNSGRSYGPHLHFELYDQGVRRNPCGYISC